MPAIASRTTPGIVALEQIVRLYYAFFNERRFAEIEQLIDPQAVFHTVPTRQRLVGRAGYRALAFAWINAFDDARLELTSMRVLDGYLVETEFTGHGTHTGDLVLGDELVIPATNRVVELPFRDRLEFADGVLVSAQLDFDSTELRTRLFGAR